MTRLALCLLALAACRATVDGAGPVPSPTAPGRAPTDNPVARYRLPWTDALRWRAVVDLDDFPGGSADARFEAAQAAVLAAGGGVVYFPPGTYRFDGSIALRSGVIVRGADPGGPRDARMDGYALPTRFVFPRYRPRFEAAGTPLETAFHGIKVADPATTSDVGVVNVGIDHGHVAFGDAPDRRAGRNRLVYGCVLRHAAVASREVPDASIGQQAWQRFTDRNRAAVHVHAGENLLVANNRLARSGEDDFVMPGYLLAGKAGEPPMAPAGGVAFDYDNRPGIAANWYPVGGSGGSGDDGTPATHPWGFRRGIVIRENFVHSTGRPAIAFAGDGVICGGNVVRFARDVVRPTVNGRDPTGAGSRNENRAVEMRGWRWQVEGNDFEVYRNLSADLVRPLNDGEGLVHEDQANSTVSDSRLVDNRGNAYLSIYRVGGVDGLLVQGNDIRTTGGAAAIYVVANRNSGKYPCRNVSIVGNVTAGSGILVACDPAEGVVIRGNTHIGPGGKLKVETAALVEENEGYMADR